MKTSAIKKIYTLLPVLFLFLSCSWVNAQDTLKTKTKTEPKEKKKHKVTRIIVSTEEDGKIVKTDTTVVGDLSFDTDNFMKNFDFNFDFDMPEPPEFPDSFDLPEPPEPPSLPDAHRFHYRYHTMSPEDKEKFKADMENMKRDMEKAKVEMEIAREEMKKLSTAEIKKQMDELKKQLSDLKKELNKEKGKDDKK